MDGRLWTYF